MLLFSFVFLLLLLLLLSEPCDIYLQDFCCVPYVNVTFLSFCPVLFIASPLFLLHLLLFFLLLLLFLFLFCYFSLFFVLHLGSKYLLFYICITYLPSCFPNFAFMFLRNFTFALRLPTQHNPIFPILCNTQPSLSQFTLPFSHCLNPLCFRTSLFPQLSCVPLPLAIPLLPYQILLPHLPVFPQTLIFPSTPPLPPLPFPVPPNHSLCLSSPIPLFTLPPLPIPPATPPPLTDWSPLDLEDDLEEEEEEEEGQVDSESYLVARRSSHGHHNHNHSNHHNHNHHSNHSHSHHHRRPPRREESTEPLLGSHTPTPHAHTPINGPATTPSGGPTPTTATHNPTYSPSSESPPHHPPLLHYSTLASRPDEEDAHNQVENHDNFYPQPSIEILTFNK